MSTIVCICAAAAGWAFTEPFNAGASYDPGLASRILTVFSHNLASMLLLVLAQVASCGLLGMGMLALNGFVGGGLLKGAPLAVVWIVPELLSACVSAASGLYLSLLAIRWLRTGIEVSVVDVQLGAAGIAISAVGILVAAVIEALAVTAV